MLRQKFRLNLEGRSLIICASSAARPQELKSAESLIKFLKFKFKIYIMQLEKFFGLQFFYFKFSFAICLGKNLN